MTRTVDQSIKPSGNNDLTSARRHVDDGIAHAHEGAWVPARDAFERAAESAPQWPDGFHNLSIALTQLGDRSGAVRAARQAAALSGAGPAVWLNLGNLAAQSDDLETAEGAFRTALGMDGNLPAAHFNLGLVLCSRLQWPEAVPHLEVAHLGRGSDQETGILPASALRHVDRVSDALEVIDALPKAAQADQAVILERAHCLTADGDTTRALSTINILLERNPMNCEGLRLKASLLANAQAWAEYDVFLAEAHARTPGNLDIAKAYVARLLEQNEAARSLEVAQTAAAANAENCDAMVLLGTCLWENTQYDEAKEVYKAALARNPQHLGALQSIASLYFEIHEFSLALSSARRGLEVEPANSRLLNTLCLAHLALGQLADGWDIGEHPESSRRRMPRSWIDPTKDWRGKDLGERIVRIRPEQGIGDEIRFSTCFPDIIAEADKCIVDCDPRLLPVFKRTYPDAVFHALDPSAREINAAPPYQFDLECLAGSLPRRYRRSLSAFPEQPRTLKTDPALGDKWRRRLDALGPTFKIGLCWRSNVIDRQRMRRFFYTHSDDWEQLYALEGVSFINLFPGATKYEIDVVREKFGVTLHQWDDLDLKDDIDDILSLINELDLVITVQAAVWTFAGALGKDALVILNPNVLMGSARVPWFPSVEPITSVWTDPWQTVSAEIAGKVRQRIDRKSRQMTEG